MKLKIIFFLRLKKENKWSKDFDQFDKFLIAFSVTCGYISIAPYTTEKLNFSIRFSILTWTVNNILKLFYNYVSRENVIIIINEERNYRKLKERIIMESHRRDIEKINQLKKVIK